MTMYDELRVVSEMAYRRERIKEFRRPAVVADRSRPRRETADEGRRTGLPEVRVVDLRAR